jgi:hypothetical protein
MLTSLKNNSFQIVVWCQWRFNVFVMNPQVLLFQIM